MDGDCWAHYAFSRLQNMASHKHGGPFPALPIIPNHIQFTSSASSDVQYKVPDNKSWIEQMWWHFQSSTTAIPPLCINECSSWFHPRVSRDQKCANVWKRYSVRKYQKREGKKKSRDEMLSNRSWCCRSILATIHRQKKKKKYCPHGKNPIAALDPICRFYWENMNMNLL